MDTTCPLILASGSPRRRELLAAAGYSFTIMPSAADESLPPGIDPRAAVEVLACRKARAVASQTDTDMCVLGADTIVVCAGRIYGKPTDADGAACTLRTLSGRTHQVMTGVCLVRGSREASFVDTTDVVFKDLSDFMIDEYIATGEPMDKAGAYGIQGAGHMLVDHIDGAFDTVVGLPVARTAQALSAFGCYPQESA